MADACVMATGSDGGRLRRLPGGEPGPEEDAKEGLGKKRDAISAEPAASSESSSALVSAAKLLLATMGGPSQLASSSGPRVSGRSVARLSSRRRTAERSPTAGAGAGSAVVCMRGAGPQPSAVAYGEPAAHTPRVEGRGCRRTCFR